MQGNTNTFQSGVRDGLPICFGYIAVSFTFGIVARGAGLSPAQAVLISITNFTSAGQFAGVALLQAAATYIEMAVTMLIINLRYCLMSCAIAQKLDPEAPFWYRFIMGLGITDEVFAVSVGIEGRLNPLYTLGAISVSLPGWVVGTLLGVLLGNVLPDRALSALSVALYGMFIAIILPPARKNRVIAALVLLSMLMSALCAALPLLSGLSAGMRVILLTIVLSGGAALLFPIREGDYAK